MRFANRVPLQYQPKACAISESVYQTNWRGYELQQPKGSLPIAPLALAVHLASVWVPFTSEAKEAVAHYDELLEEMRRALQECGRKLGAHIRARAHAEHESRRLGLFQRYIPEVAQALSDILGVPKDKAEKSFYDALPSFARLSDAGTKDDGGEGGGGGGSGPAPEPEGEATPAKKSKKTKKAAPAAPRKGKGKSGGDQLVLTE
jgi:DNA topoisomerase-6 subunit B